MLLHLEVLIQFLQYIFFLMGEVKYNFSCKSTSLWRGSYNLHCVKSARIRSYSGPYFSAFGLNTERYGASLRTQSKCGKMWTRITPNMNTFHAVLATWATISTKLFIFAVSMIGKTRDNIRSIIKIWINFRSLAPIFQVGRDKCYW